MFLGACLPAAAPASAIPKENRWAVEERVGGVGVGVRIRRVKIWSGRVWPRAVARAVTRSIAGAGTTSPARVVKLLRRSEGIGVASHRYRVFQAERQRSLRIDHRRAATGYQHTDPGDKRATDGPHTGAKTAGYSGANRCAQARGCADCRGIPAHRRRTLPVNHLRLNRDLLAIGDS